MSHAAEPIERPTRTLPSVTTEIRLLRGAVPASGGRVPALLRIVPGALDEKRKRTAIDLALVVDRSGSMGGEPIEAAKSAAHDAIDLLEDGDRAALVTFRNDVEVVLPTSDVTDRAALHRTIETIYAGGGTALHAGWVEGAQQLVDVLDDNRSARVLLLTDGMANVGVTDARSIAEDVARLKDAGVATSTVGLGRSFQEDLLTTIAEAGGGRFAFAETPADLEGLMAAEIIAADATVGTEVRASIDATSGRVSGHEVVGEVRRVGDALALADLIAEMPVEVAIALDVRAGEVETDVTLGSIRLTWTDPNGGPVEATVPIVADAIDDDAYRAADEDPLVAVGHAVGEAGRLYERAMAALDRYDHATVDATLSELDELLTGAPDDPRIDRLRARMNAARESVRMRDHGMARKRFSMEKERAYSRFDHEAMGLTAFSSEKQQSLMERRSQREGHHEGPRQGRAPANAQTVAEYELPRRNGTQAFVKLLRGDVTTVRAEALINPTNTHLHGSGRSVDGAVHRVGGRELTRETRAIGQVGLAEAVVTKGHRLPVDYVVHVAVPTYGGDEADFEVLAKCYRSAFAMARQMRIRHLSVPAIGTGTNGFPMADATQRAVATILDELERDDTIEHIDVVLFDRRATGVYEKALRTDGRATRR